MIKSHVADENPSTNRSQGSANSRPIKALKCSLESKLSRQEGRITAVENIMQESTEMYGGKNLNDLYDTICSTIGNKVVDCC